MEFGGSDRPVTRLRSGRVPWLAARLTRLAARFTRPDSQFFPNWSRQFPPVTFTWRNAKCLNTLGKDCEFAPAVLVFLTPPVPTVVPLVAARH